MWLPCVAAKPAISRATALQAHHTSGRASKQVSHPNQVALRRRCPTPQLAALQRRLQTGRGRAFKTRRPYITIITFTLQICHQRRITISSASEAALMHLAQALTYARPLRMAAATLGSWLRSGNCT